MKKKYKSTIEKPHTLRHKVRFSEGIYINMYSTGEPLKVLQTEVIEVIHHK